MTTKNIEQLKDNVIAMRDFIPMSCVHRKVKGDFGLRVNAARDEAKILALAGLLADSDMGSGLAPDQGRVFTYMRSLDINLGERALEGLVSAIRSVVWRGFQNGDEYFAYLVRAELLPELAHRVRQYNGAVERSDVASMVKARVNYMAVENVIKAYDEDTVIPKPQWRDAPLNDLRSKIRAESWSPLYRSRISTSTHCWYFLHPPSGNHY